LEALTFEALTLDALDFAGIFALVFAAFFGTERTAAGFVRWGRMILAMFRVY
jgi:hypothetical protein